MFCGTVELAGNSRAMSYEMFVYCALYCASASGFTVIIVCHVGVGEGSDEMNKGRVYFLLSAFNYVCTLITLPCLCCFDSF